MHLMTIKRKIKLEMTHILAELTQLKSSDYLTLVHKCMTDKLRCTNYTNPTGNSRVWELIMFQTFPTCHHVFL